MPAAGGLAAGGLRYAAATRAEAIQVFAANPRGWAVPPADPAQDAALRHALARGGQLGARGVVVHTGSAVGGSRTAALCQVREILLPLLDELASDGPGLLLEPMADQGTMLCSGVAELRSYLELLDWHPRAGLCLDTCHAFAAGRDLAAPGGAARLLADLDSAGCADRLALVHANDSKDPYGSGRDRHENIGSGHLGTSPFGELLGHPATAGVPFIVETPGGEQAHAADIAVLQGLRAAACGKQP